jgi:hypothetical protein
MFWNRRRESAELAFQFMPFQIILAYLKTSGQEHSVSINKVKITRHNEKPNDMYSPNIVRLIKSRRRRWAGNVARVGERRGAYRVSVGKPEGKRPLRRPWRRWEDNIKMDLKEVGCGGYGLDRAGLG